MADIHKTQDVVQKQQVTSSTGNIKCF